MTSGWPGSLPPRTESTDVKTVATESTVTVNDNVTVNVTDNVNVNDNVINTQKQNLIEIFFKDLENSSQFETIARNNGISKRELKTYIDPFKIKSELSYPSFERFISHFKNYVVNQRLKAKTVIGQKLMSKIEKALHDQKEAKELIDKIHG